MDRSRTTARRLAFALPLFATAGLLAGCVTSEKARYARLLTAQVEPGAGPGSEAVALAFGLTESPVAPERLAHAKD